MAGVGRSDDAVDFKLAFFTHRNLGTGGHIAAKAHGYGQAPEHAFRRLFAPTDFFRHGIQHRKVLGMVGRQFAT